MWSGEMFLGKFLSYPPKKNIPGLKGGDVMVNLWLTVNKWLIVLMIMVVDLSGRGESCG